MTRPAARSGRRLPATRRRLPRPLRRRALPRATPRPAATSPPAGPRPWAGTSRSATGAGTGRSPTTPAATATAPSARPPPPPTGWRPARRNSCPSSTSTSSSPCPAALGPIALQNPRVVYGLLFRAAAETLQQVAADPEHLGAEIGFLAVLHTWGQNLQHHPHVHCVVPGGGLSPDASRWVACRPGFFLPVRVLSRVFRGKFLSLLRAAFDRGRLAFHGKLSRAGRPGRIPTPARRQCPDRVGRLRQAALRRPGAGAEVPGPVHPPGGDQQPPADRPGGRPGHVPLEGLRPRREAEDDDPEGGRVHPPVPPARPAGGVRADPALRLPGQPGVPGEAGTVPQPAGDRHATRRGRAGPRAERGRRRTARGPRLPRLREGRMVIVETLPAAPVHRSGGVEREPTPERAGIDTS